MLQPHFAFKTPPRVSSFPRPSSFEPRHFNYSSLLLVLVFVATRKPCVHDCAAQMNFLLIPKELRPIAAKVEARQRISEADALDLYRSNDLNALGIMANALCEQKNGNYATYVLNRYINYSNICVLSCQFCAFATKKRDAHAFERTIDDIISAVEEARRLG